MANVDFYAVREDIRGLFHFVFEETDFRVFESYSDPGTELREFRSFHDLSNAFDLGIDEYGKGGRFGLKLWSPSVTNDVQIGRIELKPTRRRPETFRYSISGIALIHLNLGGRFENVITYSDYRHWSEAGARQRSGGDVDAVDWRTLSRLSGRVQRHLRNRIAAAKVNGRPILPAAYEEVQKGAEVCFGYTRFNANSPELRVLRRAATR